MDDVYSNSMKQQIKDMQQIADIWLVHRAISTEQHHRLCKELQDILDNIMPDKTIQSGEGAE